MKRAEYVPPDELLVVVWRDGLFLWWAELWRPHQPGYDPPPPPGDLLRGGRRGLLPVPPPGYVRCGLRLCATRWTAQRHAKRMADRVRRGLHPIEDPPAYETYTCR